ncbi:MAG: hydrogenase formation protein HypD [Rivihabitans pingtungensis]
MDEFRDGHAARALAAEIAAVVQPDRQYRMMEFCGGHTHIFAIACYGLSALLPDNVTEKLIHGPGCPVCAADWPLDGAIAPGAGTRRDLVHVRRHPARARFRAHELVQGAGGWRRCAHGVFGDDALALARAELQRQVVFFAIGFETTTPPTALALLTARAEGLSNFSVYANHAVTPAVMRHLLASGDGVALDGFIGPSHVSTVIGSDAYADIARDSGKPVVITGFEPLDVLIGVRMLIEQINQGRAEVENQFIRAVTATGNRKARQVVDEVFALRPAFDWRGLGEVVASALAIRPEWSAWDAEVKFGLTTHSVADNKACECGAILQGRKKPQDCKVFATVCTPDNPLGACMVSSEGACAAHYAYGRFVSKEPA